MKLYEMTDAYNEVLAKIDEGIDAAAIADTLESITEDIAEKAENIAKLMKSIETDENGIKAEEERLANRRKALTNHRNSLKEYLEYQLDKANLTKVSGKVFTIAIQNNPPSVNVTGNVPERFYTQAEPVVSKKLLLEALKNGEKVEGAELVQTKSLRIR